MARARGRMATSRQTVKQRRFSGRMWEPPTAADIQPASLTGLPCKAKALFSALDSPHHPSALVPPGGAWPPHPPTLQPSTSTSLPLGPTCNALGSLVARQVRGQQLSKKGVGLAQEVSIHCLCVLLLRLHHAPAGPANRGRMASPRGVAVVMGIQRRAAQDCALVAALRLTLPVAGGRQSLARLCSTPVLDEADGGIELLPQPVHAKQRRLMRILLGCRLLQPASVRSEMKARCLQIKLSFTGSFRCHAKTMCRPQAGVPQAEQQFAQQCSIAGSVPLLKLVELLPLHIALRRKLGIPVQQ